MYFYIEWIIATPLLLINFGKLATLQLNEYLLLLIANELLFIFGYVFNITADLVIAMPFFGIAATSYIGIIVFLFYKYNTLKAQYDILQRKITNCLIYSTFIILNIYPVISLLYKFNCLTMDQIVIAYVILDIFAKGFFTFIIIGLRELVTRRSSITSYVTRRALRITPLEIQNYDTEVNIRTSSVDEFCRRVDIDGESKVESLQEY
jgi:bacteriorhodopsin